MTKTYDGFATHFNGNIFCCVDTETTGLRPGYHDIIQICVLPINKMAMPNKEMPYFHCLIKPKRPENVDSEAGKVNRNKLAEAINFGLEPETAEERLREWFQNIGLPQRKGIVPLGHNHCFDREMIMDWLGGPLSYQEFFRSDYRDTMQMALLCNDWAAWHGMNCPFPKVGLSFIAGRLGIEQNNAHDAIGDCLTTIEVYRRLMRWKDFYTIV
jgi:DNA polymerase III epsilon subunit-like protein